MRPRSLRQQVFVHVTPRVDSQALLGEGGRKKFFFFFLFSIVVSPVVVVS